MDILARQLLTWYDKNGRDLPWRVKKGAHGNPYAVWISEIMLQQTTVKTVRDYFIRWMERFPDIQTLANAAVQDVLFMWQGLGYYTRAKKIHECARVLVEKYNGRIPSDRETLLKLPGIGPYTASSICAFAFNLPETVVDGNVIRVIARLKGIRHEVDRDEIYQKAAALTPEHHGADYASAIMDLGATICTPAAPKCLICPWQNTCIANREKLTEQIPLIKKMLKRERSGFVYLIKTTKGAFFIRQRPGKGLLSGLYEFPWHYGDKPLVNGGTLLTAQSVTHVFTHFKLLLRPVLIQLPPEIDSVHDIENWMTKHLSGTDNQIILEALKDAFLAPPEAFKGFPFSTLMAKVMKQTIQAALHNSKSSQ